MIILAHIRNASALSPQTYGSPRLHVALNEAGIAVGCHRTARVMRANGRNAFQKTRCKRTTDNYHGEPVAAKVRSQDFRGDRADQKWGADIRSIWTSAG